MSEMEKHEDISRYDSMSTQELQEILRKHAHGELDTEPDTQELYEIMEVLSVRRQNENPQAFRSDEEAYAEFCEQYMPKKNAVARPKVIQFPNRILKTVAAVLTVVLILAVSTSITAEALHFDLWGRLANWTKEIFQFTDIHSGTTDANPEKEYNAELKSLQDALNDHRIVEKLVPTWIPDEYMCKDVSVTETPRVLNIYAIYEKDGSELVIKIRQTIGTQAPQIEKNDDLLEVYVADGVEYYIFSNTETLQVTWRNEEFECVIGGKISLEEMRAMINSIS